MLANYKLPRLLVQPGESRLIREQGILSTLLGSCVGITFWVERLRFGALCHPMLPSAPARWASHSAGNLRFVDYAIRDLATRFDALRVTRKETEVKVFGGADVLDLDQGRARPTVGRLNREAAVRILRAEGYRVAASSLGGHSGMQIHFNTSTGEVLVRRLGRNHHSSDPHYSRQAKTQTCN